MEIQKHDSKEKYVKSFRPARVRFTEFGDYECSICAKAHVIIKEIEKEFGDQLEFEFRNFPLVQLHPHALLAAEAAEAARSQGKFEEMHDALLESHDRLSAMTIAKLARKIELNPDRFTLDMAAHVYLRKIERDMSEGFGNGVQGTPTFFINGEILEDDWDFESLTSVLRDQLGENLEI